MEAHAPKNKYFDFRNETLTWKNFFPCLEGEILLYVIFLERASDEDDVAVEDVSGVRLLVDRKSEA